jgi:hypothetical protein
MKSFITSPSIIRMIKSRRMRWVRHAARMEPKRNANKEFDGKARETTGKTNM